MLSHNCTAVVTEVVRKALTLTRHIAASQLLSDYFKFELDTYHFSTFQVGIKTEEQKLGTKSYLYLLTSTLRLPKSTRAIVHIFNACTQSQTFECVSQHHLNLRQFSHTF